MWWHTHVSLAPRMLRQEDRKFQTSLGYIVKICLKDIKERKEEGGRQREILNADYNSMKWLAGSELTVAILCRPVVREPEEVTWQSTCQLRSFCRVALQS